MRGSRLAGTGLVLATGFGFAMPGVAQGQVPDYRAGEVLDPPGDASIANPDYGGGTGEPRLLDIRKVTASYDAEVGALDLYFEGESLYNQTHSSITFNARVTAPNPITGRCDSTLRDGDFSVSATGWQGYDLPQEAYLSDATGALVARGYIEWPGSGASPHIAFNTASLVRRNFRCVSDIHGIRGTSGYLGSSRDDVMELCLAGCPSGGEASPPPTIVPTVRVNGNTLTWNRVGNANSYVVATSNVAEGVPGRRHHVSGGDRNVIYAPICPGNDSLLRGPRQCSRDGVVNPGGVDHVRGDARHPAARREYSRPGRSPGDPAARWRHPRPGRSAGSGPGAHARNTTVNQGVIVGTPNRSAASRRLTVAKAKAVARRALVARYGTSFARRTKHSYKVACTIRGARATCRVQWRYGRSRYRGELTITRTVQGNLWRTAISAHRSAAPSLDGTAGCHWGGRPLEAARAPPRAVMSSHPQRDQLAHLARQPFGARPDSLPVTPFRLESVRGVGAQRTQTTVTE